MTTTSEYDAESERLGANAEAQVGVIRSANAALLKAYAVDPRGDHTAEHEATHAAVAEHERLVDLLIKHLASPRPLIVPENPA